MPPKTPTKITNGNVDTMTARERELLALAMECVITDPAIDMKRFADKAGFTNQGSAANAWRNIRNKLGLRGASAPGTPDGKASDTISKKRAKSDHGHDTDDISESPSKTPARASRKKVKKEETQDEIHHTVVKPEQHESDSDAVGAAMD